MIVLIDTNILIDFLKGRKPFAENAEQLFTKCYTVAGMGDRLRP
jgi:predicted nucleic acid-binding protein